MNKRVKKKWIKALESGKYKQTTGKLKGKQGYCCLGVLCDLHAKETGKKWEPTGSYNAPEYLGETGRLPFTVCKWAGIDDDTGSYIDKKTEKASSLVKKNDGKKCNFKAIAKIIKENF